jgi:D-alanyl-D-alanine carboxypeptidase/D-alanyl-D-alanine-endopeptidase (penicillin-binding protein 4)
LLISCSVSKQINKKASAILLNDTVISTGHIGISLYEPATDKYWYNHNATKNFIPASNLKLFSLYAGMKWLGDSLPGIRYQQQSDGVIIYPTGDPAFLHPDFKQQPVFEFLKTQKNIRYAPAHFNQALGTGWSWDDYNDSYMVQRSELPIYGNLARIYYNNGVLSTIPKRISVQQNPFDQYGDSTAFSFTRKWENNDIIAAVTPQQQAIKEYEIPLVVDQNKMIEFLADTLHKHITTIDDSFQGNQNNRAMFHVIHSQPADSLFKPMMYNSDNFFAEQTLLMASNEHLGYMSDEAMIDTLLKRDLKDIPQQPTWVDGSGLSRYNLFSPQAMVYIIHKIQTEFGVQRLKTILPTGGTGTIKNYYIKDSGYLFAKTGSLSNVIALSGFMYTKKGKQIIFSVLVNNFLGPAYKVRRAIEKFLEGIRETY